MRSEDEVRQAFIQSPLSAVRLLQGDIADLEAAVEVLIAAIQELWEPAATDTARNTLNDPRVVKVRMK